MTVKLTGSRSPIPAEVTVQDGLETGHVSRHPAYATVGFYHLNGGSGATDLFGANIRSHSTIRMKVSRAHMVTKTVERVSEDETILELEMTQAQFTQAITQFNSGTGTPVTLRQAPDLDVKPVVYPQIARMDVEEKVKSAGDKRVDEEIKRVIEAFAKVQALAEADGSISKKSMQAAVHRLGALMQNLPVNLEYFKELLREDAGKVLHEGKLELHAAASLIASEGGRPLMIERDD